MTTPSPDFMDRPDRGMPGWLQAWNRFWFAPTDPTGLGLMRLLCGLLVVYVHLVYSYDLFSYLGPHAWMDQAAQNYVRKEADVYVPETTWTEMPRPSGEHGQYFWSIYYHVHDPSWIVVIHVGILAVMLLFTAGLWTRVTSVLAWMGAIQYVQRLPTSMFGMDTMMIILLTYLMIGDSGAALSVDRWLEVRGRRRELGPKADLSLKPSWSANFAIRLVQINFCMIYMTSGLSKLLGSTWWSGTALWFCFANYNFAPMRVPLYNVALTFLCQHLWLWQLSMTAGAVFTLFTEISFTYLVWNRRLRPFMVTCSALMHLGIGLGMSLVVFSMFMLVMVAAFVPPDQMRIFVDTWADRLRSRFKPKAPSASRPISVSDDAPVLART